MHKRENNLSRKAQHQQLLLEKWETLKNSTSGCFISIKMKSLYVFIHTAKSLSLYKMLSSSQCCLVVFNILTSINFVVLPNLLQSISLGHG